MRVNCTVTCFHCGNATPGNSAFAIDVDGTRHAVCCAGCEAAAMLVLSEGLGRYYEFRSVSAPPSTDERNWSIYDREQALRRYTHQREDGTRELSVQVDGMHCAACAWLIEGGLRALPGLLDIHVNASSRRAHLRFDPKLIGMGVILERIFRLGYRPQPLSFTADNDPSVNERREALRRLGVAGIGMMQVMTYAVSLYAGAMDGMAPNLARLLRFVSLLVATPVVLYAAQPFFVAAWRGLRTRTLVMDLPVALSISAAYLWSVWTTLRGVGEVYFDSAVMFTFFLLLGRYIEMSLRQGYGVHNDAIARLLPESALRIAQAHEERVLPDELLVGDRLRVLPGERIAADGIIVAGMTFVDESLLSGEALPRGRAAGDTVTAGTLNLESSIEIRVTAVGHSSTLAAISRLLAYAHANRPRIAEVADRFASWFVGGILLLAAAVASYWLHADATRVFPTVLAVLVVTCPCALSLATPAALAAAMTRLARLGLLVTRSRALETLSRVDIMVFDKTGTLSTARIDVTEIRVLNPAADVARCAAIAAALERHSEHPIARAFTAIRAATDVTSVHCVPGSGIEGRVSETMYRIGRAEYVLGICTSDGAAALPQESTSSSVFLGDTQGLLAEFLLSEGLRPEAFSTIIRLNALGIASRIASGDRNAPVLALAHRLEIPGKGDLRAADKVRLVRELQSQGHTVGMVGDGINDAPVLAAANVSAAIGSGTDLAKVNADIVLMSPSLEALAAGIETSRRCMRIIRQNIAWAVLYNATAVPLAAAGWLQPWMAAIGMSASSLLVALNAMRLLRVQRIGAPGLPRLTETSVSVPA
jgi:Cu2+-exporting ATPase